MFKTFDEDKNDTLEYNEFKKMLDHLRKKEELTNLFKKYKKDGSEIM
jgi:Ca2+-binding EF-hand superfamily protein